MVVLKCVAWWGKSRIWCVGARRSRLLFPSQQKDCDPSPVIQAPWMEGRAGEVADEKTEQRKWLQRKEMKGVQKIEGKIGVKLK